MTLKRFTAPPEDGFIPPSSPDPPTYETCIEAIGDKKNTMLAYDRNPGPATAGKSFYNYDSEEWNSECSLGFGLYPNPLRQGSGGAPTPEGQPWVARILVKCPDIPRMMREGFHWTDENILPEEGYIKLEREEKAFRWKRNYFLADLQHPRRWVARVFVEASNLKTLSDFKLSHHLSKATVIWCRAWAQAWGKDNLMIYNFEYDDPEYSFNAIYDDMPLDGWWPWPKAGEGK
ncbi:hypothetical protein F4777DRAFT_540691 [Nemania sp. FL0916]|nr:hypothetical protein F4777DRAFT_540691 [Nemania sp. FL0916]